MDATLSAYIESALWSSVDDEGEPLDRKYSVNDLADETVATMASELEDFMGALDRKEIDASSLTTEQIGHDFWLTRNGHGAGFWDRGLGELGEALTAVAKTYGESDLYVGDDGKLYVA